VAKQSGRHELAKRWHGWNRGDVAILACGLMGFLSFTFGGPLLDQQGEATPGTSTAVHSMGTTSFELPSPLAVSGLPTAPPEASPAAVPPASAPVAAAPLLPEASAPQRIVYPKAAMDTAVHPLAPDSSAVESQTIVPPETKDGYWLTPFGVPGNGSANTTYVIGHSWEGQDAPFNHLSLHREHPLPRGQRDHLPQGHAQGQPYLGHGAQPAGADQLLHRRSVGEERGGLGVPGLRRETRGHCSSTRAGQRIGL
jgi:hypothetical protein